MRTMSSLSLMVVGLLGVAGCQQPKPPVASGPAEPAFAGEWRAQLQFTTGAFAAVKDLEFMYVFNSGGTMTESSNYDAAPPVPPAYGIWRKVGSREYEARYEFYITKPPAAFGVFVEHITVSEDGKSFTSKIRYDAFDTAGKPAEGGGEATGRGVKLVFQDGAEE